MKNTYSSGFKALLGVSLAVTAAVAQAQTVPVDALENTNLIGLAAGVAPDYMGSNHRKGAVGPIFRYQLPGSERYFLLLGPQATFNILDDPNWRFGPMVQYRQGRGTDVDDPVVKRMVGINNTAEGGVFVTYKLKLSEEKMHQINFTGDVAGSGNGTVGTLRMMWWQPIREGTLFNLGVGTTLANGKWMQTYFGVTNASDIALYPSLAGRPFNAGSGLKGVTIPFGVTQALSKEWLLSVGARYEKLMNDAKDSPVVSQRGSQNQWIGGAAINYLF
jgi:outer membrane protein